MVSRPAFDPNLFAAHIKSAEWNALTTNPDKPLFNRAIQAELAPGSTFKPLVALAGLETGTIDENFSVRCGGGANFYGRFFKCWVKGGHGGVNMHNGIVHSCDVFFYTVGNKLGIDNIAEYAEQAGLGKKTGIDLPGEAEGLDAVLQVEAAHPAREMVRGRNNFGRHRTGCCDSHADPACLRDRWNGEWRRLV